MLYVCILFHGVFKTFYCRLGASNGWTIMKNELNGMWKDAIVAYLNTEH
jgi:hypothetical protein